jgi:hypothetical protein
MIEAEILARTVHYRPVMFDCTAYYFWCVHMPINLPPQRGKVGLLAYDWRKRRQAA